MRRIIYREIASDLRRRVAEGEFQAGHVLPSEAGLSASYDASRVTVRKALELLRDEGLVDSRQGFGWFVAADPVQQSLDSLGTIEDQLGGLGVVSERRVLGFAFVPSPQRISDLLGVSDVLEVRRLNLADGRPFGRVTVWCPEPYGVDLSRSDLESSTFYELLPVEVGSARQTIGAAAASDDDAADLEIPVGSPVLRCERVTSDTTGKPVLVSEHVFPAHLTEFSVDLGPMESSLAPSGLRLVD